MEIAMESAMDEVIVNVAQEESAFDLPLPSYATLGSAGMDLYADIPQNEPMTLLPGKRVLVSTGLRIALPQGFEAQIRPRSGLAVRHGIGILNAPGTIDSDYRGIIKIILMHWGEEPFIIRRGDRIAQMVVAPITQVKLVKTQNLSTTERGEGGFGSTG